jgi:hypothetical protein
MTIKVNNTRENEVVMTVGDAVTILGMAKFALEDLTDEFSNERAVELMRREIDIVNKLDKVL